MILVIGMILCNILMRILNFIKGTKHVDSRINCNQKVLYIHIPKTGGTSVINALGFNKTTHLKAEEIFNSKDKKLLTQRYSFTVVRHPISRFLSLYNYACLEVSYYHDNINPEKAEYGIHLDYELLKDVDINTCVQYLIEGKLQHDHAWNHWDPQFTWLYSSNDRLLIKKIYKLEDLKKLEYDLTSVIGDEFRLPKLNQSSFGTIDLKKQIKELSTDSLNKLYKYYEKDFQLLGYDRDEYN